MDFQREQQGATGRVGRPARVVRAREYRIHRESYRRQSSPPLEISRQKKKSSRRRPSEILLIVCSLSIERSKPRVERIEGHCRQREPLAVARGETQTRHHFAHEPSTLDGVVGPAQPRRLDRPTSTATARSTTGHDHGRRRVGEEYRTEGRRRVYRHVRERKYRKTTTTLLFSFWGFLLPFFPVSTVVQSERDKRGKDLSFPFGVTTKDYIGHNREREGALLPFAAELFIHEAGADKACSRCKTSGSNLIKRTVLLGC